MTDATPAAADSLDTARNGARMSIDSEPSVGEHLRGLFEEADSRSELLGIAMHVLGGRADEAAEVLQAAFLRCWERRDRLCMIDNLRGYVATTVANTARDEFRRQRRRPAVPLTTEELERDGRLPERNRPSAGPGAALEQAELVAAARRAIQSLRPEDREVFLLRQNAELAYAEIAEQLGLPEGTVKTRMRRALQVLRASLPDA